MLNIKDAIRLYVMLKDFVPDYDASEDNLEFASKIIVNIKESDRPEVFGESILLMCPKINVQRLTEMNPLKIIEMFIDGLDKNKFFSLKKFCEALGYGR